MKKTLCLCLVMLAISQLISCSLSSTLDDNWHMEFYTKGISEFKDVALSDQEKYLRSGDFADRTVNDVIFMLHMDKYYIYVTAYSLSGFKNVTVESIVLAEADGDVIYDDGDCNTKIKMNMMRGTVVSGLYSTGAYNFELPDEYCYEGNKLELSAVINVEGTVYNISETVDLIKRKTD